MITVSNTEKQTNEWEQNGICLLHIFVQYLDQCYENVQINHKQPLHISLFKRLVKLQSLINIHYTLANYSEYIMKCNKKKLNRASKDSNYNYV